MSIGKGDESQLRNNYNEVSLRDASQRSSIAIPNMKLGELSFRAEPTAEVFNGIVRKLIGSLRDTEQFGVAGWRMERHRGAMNGTFVPPSRRTQPTTLPYYTTLHNTIQPSNAAVRSVASTGKN